MKDSEGKQVARNLFYLKCLPDWLSEEQLISGEPLILLGEEDRELTYFDTLGIPRNRITSVEIDRGIHYKQRALRSGIQLVCRDIGEYLREQLHANYRHHILNLDICGQYRTHIDQAMAPVLLFCCRNPQTVVATYSNIGRDPHTLWEGAKSLAILYWILGEEIYRFTERLAACYEVAGYESPICCALRDLFWIRSIFENAMISNSIFFRNGKRIIAEYFAHMDAIWEATFNPKCKDLRVRHLLDSIESAQHQTPIVEPQIHIQLDRQRHVIYRAAEPWNQRCYFSRFVLSGTPCHASEWLIEFLNVFEHGEMNFVGRNGELETIHNSAELPTKPFTRETILLTKKTSKRFYREFVPRVLPEFEAEHYRSAHHRILLELQIKQRGTEMAKRTTSRNGTGQTLVKRGKLTKQGTAKVKELAGEGLNVEEILEELELNEKTTPTKSIRAHVAIARRNSHFIGEDGNLNNYGKEFIRALATRGYDIDEVLNRVPNELKPRSVRSIYNHAKK